QPAPGKSRSSAGGRHRAGDPRIAGRVGRFPVAEAITVPRLGWSMEEGTFAGWLKQDGDQIKPGDALFVLESDKAAEEIEALDAGILRLLPEGPKGGDTVRVGQVLAYLAAAGEVIPTGVRN